MVKLLREYFEFVRFSHTIFALPFAFGSMLVAAHGIPEWRIVGLILAAMVCARTAAMGFNRIADRRIDALNPRTAQRHLPAGKISVTGAWCLVIGSGTGLIVSSYFINEICFFLSPVALVVIFFYSLTKRFTSGSHLFLGVSLSLSVMGAWLAVTGGFAWPPIALAIAVVFWVAGFDIIYAIQDIDFDRAQGLHSLPVRMGVPAALSVAQLLHWITIGALAVFGWISHLNWSYYGGLVIIFTSLVVEHWLAARRDKKWLDVAFFRLNALISVLFLISVILGIYFEWPIEWLKKHGPVP